LRDEIFRSIGGRAADQDNKKIKVK